MHKFIPAPPARWLSPHLHRSSSTIWGLGQKCEFLCLPHNSQAFALPDSKVQIIHKKLGVQGKIPVGPQQPNPTIPKKCRPASHVHTLLQINSLFYHTKNLRFSLGSVHVVGSQKPYLDQLLSISRLLQCVYHVPPSYVLQALTPPRDSREFWDTQRQNREREAQNILSFACALASQTLQRQQARRSPVCFSLCKTLPFLQSGVICPRFQVSGSSELPMMILTRSQKGVAMDAFNSFLIFNFSRRNQVTSLGFVSPAPPSQYGVESTLKQMCLSKHFGQVTYRTLGKPPQVTLNGFDLLSGQASFAWPRVDLALPLRRKKFRPFLDYILRVWQHLLDSFLQLGKLH